MLKILVDRGTLSHFHHLPDVEWLEKRGRQLGKKATVERKEAVTELMFVCDLHPLTVACSNGIAL